MDTMITPTSFEQVAGWLDQDSAALAGEDVQVAHAVGRVLCADVSAPATYPAVPTATVDGFALAASTTVGAGDYGPLPVRVGRSGDANGTEAVPVFSGQALPAGTDSVVPAWQTERSGEILEVHVPLACGENVVPAGAEVSEGECVLASGRVLRPADIALLINLRVTKVVVVRRPRVAVAATRGDVADATGSMIACLVSRDGGVPYSLELDLSDTDGETLADNMADTLLRGSPHGGVDLLLVVGGSGLGSNDRAASTLTQVGELLYRGVAINPGETTSVGRARGTTVVILPGPPLAALVGYDLLASRVVRQLGGLAPGLPYATRRLTLAGKIASGLGRLEYARVRLVGDRLEPIAVADNRTLSTAVRADGFVLVPEHSEGFPSGSIVTVYFYDHMHS